MGDSATLRLQDLTVIVNPHTIVSLARFDSVRALSQDLVQGAPPSVCAAGVRGGETEETEILAWFATIDHARQALQFLTQAVLQGRAVVDWTGGTREPHPAEMDALAQAKHAAQNVAAMSPEELARYTAARQQMPQQGQQGGPPQQAQPDGGQPHDWGGWTAGGGQGYQQPQPAGQQAQGFVPPPGPPPHPGALPQPAQGQNWRPVPRPQVRQPGQQGG